MNRIREFLKAVFIALTCTHERNQVIRHGYNFTIVCRRCGKVKRVRVIAAQAKGRAI